MPAYCRRLQCPKYCCRVVPSVSRRDKQQAACRSEEISHAEVVRDLEVLHALLLTEYPWLPGRRPVLTSPLVIRWRSRCRLARWERTDMQPRTTLDTLSQDPPSRTNFILRVRRVSERARAIEPRCVGRARRLSASESDVVGERKQLTCSTGLPL